jgi:PI-3-kinase-related kinase SMG-1
MAKLRTPLGKPQETFTTIEASIKQLLVQLKKMDEDSAGSGAFMKCQFRYMYFHLLVLIAEPSPEIMVRVLALVEFMDCLEKLLYNAFEGTAQTIITPPKIVRIFFRTNRGTCQEWIARVRPALAQIAFHCNHKGAALRHCMAGLKEMNDAGKLQVSCLLFDVLCL